MSRFDILAIGELNADYIITGMEGPPELNKEVSAGGFKKGIGSSTAICAANMANLGLSVAFCGKTGDDEDGHYIVDELYKRGVDTGFCVVDKSTVTGATIGLNWGGDRALVTVLGAISELSLKDFDLSITKCARHIHVGAYFMQTALQGDLPRIFEEARKNGITTSLDAGWDMTGNWNANIRDTLKYTDFFIPNETEALNITGERVPEAAAEKLAEFCGSAVVKCGSKGAVLVSGGKRYFAETVKGVKVIDTTGAGDSFNAGFIYAYLHGFSPEKCLAYGNACGALAVSNVGGVNDGLTAEKAGELVAAVT